jgi:hypothetical protein
MPQDSVREKGTAATPGESPETSDSDAQLPSLALSTGLESKESRRRVLSRLDHLLDQLELANLAELPSPPHGVVSQMAEHGLPDAVRYTIPELIEIIFNSQRPLMRANRDGFWASLPYDDDEGDRRFPTRWGPDPAWEAAVS